MATFSVVYVVYTVKMAVTKMFRPSVAIGLFYGWTGYCSILSTLSLNPALSVRTKSRDVNFAE